MIIPITEKMLEDGDKYITALEEKINKMLDNIADNLIKGGYECISTQLGTGTKEEMKQRYNITYNPRKYKEVTATEYELLLKRFRHLLKSETIALYDEIDPMTFVSGVVEDVIYKRQKELGV